MRYQLTQAAEEDLADIWRYIAANSSTAADRFLDLLYAKFISLARSPFIGMPYGELREGLRSFAVKNHVISFALWRAACRSSAC